MGILHTILTYLWNALMMSLQQIFILIGPGLILAFLLNYVAVFVEKRAYGFMGQGVYLTFFGGIGTIIHELGHAFFCIVFRHEIIDMELFSPNPKSGSLGYVKHSYNPDSNYQVIGNFFIGIGPILFGSTVIYFCSKYLVGENLFSSLGSLPVKSFTTGYWDYFLEITKYIYLSVKSLTFQLFTVENLSNWKTYLFLYLVFCIGSSITLSPPDIKSAFLGFASIVGTLFFINVVTMWTFPNQLANIFAHITQYYTAFYMVMVLVILMNLIAGVVFMVIPKVKEVASHTI